MFRLLQHARQQLEKPAGTNASPCAAGRRVTAARADEDLAGAEPLRVVNRPLDSGLRLRVGASFLIRLLFWRVLQNTACSPFFMVEVVMEIVFSY